MGKIDEVCRGIVERVDGAAACGVIDLETRMVLGIHESAQCGGVLDEVLAVAAASVFGGTSIRRIEQGVRLHREHVEDGQSLVHEVHVTSKNHYHFMRSIKEGRAAIVLLTDRTTNVGMGWAQLKSAIDAIEPQVP